jgi:hypothetical protein
MSIEQDTNATPVEDNLDDFSADFFGQKQAEPEPASSEDDAGDDTTETDAQEVEDTETDTLADEDDSEEEDEGDEGGEEDSSESDAEAKPEPKKKNRFQERIDELVGKEKAAERRAEELEAKLAELAAKLPQDEPKPAPKQVEADDTEPKPNDENEDGTAKYPLGEFDPNFIRALTKHTISYEREQALVQQKQELARQAEDKQKAELQSKWQEKLTPAQERYPDFVEKGQQLTDTFSGINEAYGEYLSATLMSMDYGPDVLYYLANNPDEASKIVNSGPNMATVALGRLEAKFADADETKQKARPKVSNAPAPPGRVNKGSSVSRPSVKPDTDDLDAFETSFFKKKR